MYKKAYGCLVIRKAKSKIYGLDIHKQKALVSCNEKLSTFRNKAMAKQKFYFLRFAQKSMYPKWGAE